LNAENLVTRLEPKIRQHLEEAIDTAEAIGPRPALLKTFDSIGMAAILLLPLVVVEGLALPAFLYVAFRDLCDWALGQVHDFTADHQRAISDQLSKLANQVASAFYGDVKTQVAELHRWQEQALRDSARSVAAESISWLW
jgi:hypothetical protein